MLDNCLIKKYKDGSTGNYLCKCRYCHRNFIGHRNDYWCGECRSQKKRKNKKGLLLAFAAGLAMWIIFYFLMFGCSKHGDRLVPNHPSYSDSTDTKKGL